MEREQAKHSSESAEALSFGQWFRLRRDALGMTQKDLALKAGCAIATVRAIEQESMRPSSGMANALGQQLRAPEETEQFVSLFMNVARGLVDISVLPPPNPLISAKRPQPQMRPPCPYLGIQAFSIQDKERFFGRQDEVRDLRSKLAHHRLLFVIGPSGSGKSSLIQAGLIPALSESAQFPQGTWTHLTIRPGAAPLEELSHQLGGSLETIDLTLDMLTRNEREPRLLLLIVDPFEDVFTQAPASAPTFFRTLTQIATHPNCYVILVTRADFFGELMAPPYWAIVQQQRVELAPLRGEHLRSAIVEPAQAAQVTIEPVLVDRLISDADDAPGVLPLVQETLVRLWDEIRNMTITLDAYKALGRTAGSPIYLVLADRADMAMADKNLSEVDRQVAWRVLLRLVQFGEGRTNTRRQQPIRALRSADDDGAMLKRVITHLAAARLLTLGKNYANVAVVDVSHEALLTHWPALTARLDRHRAAELTRRNFDALAAQWQTQVEQGGPSRLLQSAEVQEIEEWLSSDEATIVGHSSAIEDLLAASCTAITEQRVQIEEAQRQVEDARRQVEHEQHQRAGQRRILLILASIVGIVVIALSYMFFTNSGVFRPIESWIRLGVYDGAVSAVAIDSQNSQTLYMATLDGNVLKRSNGDNQWSLVGNLQIAQDEQVTQMAITPDGTTLYVGTSRGHLWRFVNGIGQDLGSVGNAKVSAKQLYVLLIDPRDSTIIYAVDATHAAVYRGRNQGTQWDVIEMTGPQKSQSPITALIAVDNGSQTTLYAGDAQGALWQGIASGNTLQGMKLSKTLSYIQDLVLDPNSDQILYAITGDGLYRITLQSVSVSITQLSRQSGNKGAMSKKYPNTLFFTTVNDSFMILNTNSSSEPVLIASASDFPNSAWLSQFLIAPTGNYVVYVGTEFGCFGWNPSRQRAVLLK